ncbi:hypothetical protein EI94DRAFT_1762818 [Lactarius quietus]|nr:hypothetical protein EI94DRAFT_1762818 [Lactarius quietus]
MMHAKMHSSSGGPRPFPRRQAEKPKPPKSIFLSGEIRRLEADISEHPFPGSSPP